MSDETRGELTLGQQRFMAPPEASPPAVPHDPYAGVLSRARTGMPECD